jgi:hypothetical protein
MDAIETFRRQMTISLQQKDYLLENEPIINGTRGLLYARSRRAYPLVFSRVISHFLFMNWEDNLFSRKDQMLDAYRSFNRQVNRSFHIPNVWRLTLPHMVLGAVSNTGVDDDTPPYVRKTGMVPFKGGEAGQYMLVDLMEKEVTTFQAYGYRQPAEAPLRYAQDELIPMLHGCLR